MKIYALIFLICFATPALAQSLTPEQDEALQAVTTLIRFDVDSETLNIKKMITSDALNVERIAQLDAKTQIREKFVLINRGGSYVVGEYSLRREDLETYFFEEQHFRLNSGFRTGYTQRITGYAKNGTTLWKVKSSDMRMYGKGYPSLESFDYIGHRNYALSAGNLY